MVAKVSWNVQLEVFWKLWYKEGKNEIKNGRKENMNNEKKEKKIWRSLQEL